MSRQNCGQQHEHCKGDQAGRRHGGNERLFGYDSGDGSFVEEKSPVDPDEAEAAIGAARKRGAAGHGGADSAARAAFGFKQPARV